MADFILACDDAGKIFRYDGSTWTAVYTNGHAGLAVQQLFSPKNAPNIAIALYGTDTFDPSFGYLNGILHSTDAGATWTETSTTLSGRNLNATKGGFNVVMDEAGTALYAVNVDGTAGVFTSTDWGATWTSVHVSAFGNYPEQLWVQGGYLWWTELNSGDGHTYLVRYKLDGSDFRQDDATHHTAGGDDYRGEVVFGTVVDDTLLLCNTGSLGRIEDGSVGGVPTLGIVATPTGTPAIAWPLPSLAGFDTLSGGDSGLQMANLLVSGGTVLVLIEDTTTGVDHVFRSTNSGATFTDVYQTTADTGFASAPLVCQTFGSPNAIWAALDYPNVYRSTDDGATWTKVTATGTSGSAWQGICHAAPTTLPGLSMFQVSDGAQQYFQAFS